MSCGFTNDATASHGPSPRWSTSSPNSSTTCSANTPSRTAPESAGLAPCASRPIQPENPNGSSRSALRYATTASGIGLPVVVRRHQTFVASRDREIGKRDVPLAPIVRLISPGAEPVTQRRNRVGVQPHHRRIIAVLGRASRLRHAMQRRVLPREQRRAAGHARHRPRVVPMKLQPPIAQRFPGPQLVATELDTASSS